MRKIITSLSSALLIFVATLSFTGVAKSAEFFTIGTGGPTGVYFQTGNAICKMLHKSAISAEHGRKKGTAKAYRCTAPSIKPWTGAPVRFIGLAFALQVAACSIAPLGNPTEYPNASILPSQRALTCSEEVSSVVALNILISAPIAFINSSIVPL